MTGSSLLSGEVTASEEYMLVNAKWVDWLYHPKVSVARIPES